MTRFSFTITIPAGASANVNLATAAFAGTQGKAFPNGHTNVYGTTYLPCCRLEAFMDDGDTGEGYIGGSDVDHTGAGSPYIIPKPAAAGTPGLTQLIASYEDNGKIDLAALYAHGSVQSDKLTIVYWQA